MAASRSEIALVIWQLPCHLRPKILSQRIWNKRHNTLEKSSRLDLLPRLCLKRGRNGNPENPFPSNSTHRWKRRKPNPSSAYAGPTLPVAAISSLQPMFPTDYQGGPGINLCQTMSMLSNELLLISDPRNSHQCILSVGSIWSQSSTSCQNLFCGRQPPETLNQLVQILTEILRNSFNFNWQVENPVGNTELAIFECGQWNIRPTIEAAARPRLRSDAPALLCRWSDHFG